MEVDAEMEAFAVAQGIKAKRSLQFAASEGVSEPHVPLSSGSKDGDAVGTEQTGPPSLPEPGARAKGANFKLPVAAGQFDPTVASPQQFKRPWRTPRPSALLGGGHGKPRKALVLSSASHPVDQRLAPTEEYRDKSASSQGDSQGDSQEQEEEEALGESQTEVSPGPPTGGEGQDSGGSREGTADRQTLTTEACSIPLKAGNGSNELPKSTSIVRMAHALAIDSAEVEASVGLKEREVGIKRTAPLSGSRRTSHPDDVHMASPAGKHALHCLDSSQPSVQSAGEASVAASVASSSATIPESWKEDPVFQGMEFAGCEHQYTQRHFDRYLQRKARLASLPPVEEQSVYADTIVR